MKLYLSFRNLYFQGLSIILANRLILLEVIRIVLFRGMYTLGLYYGLTTVPIITVFNGNLLKCAAATLSNDTPLGPYTRIPK
jgi:hypothetical protein